MIHTESIYIVIPEISLKYTYCNSLHNVPRENIKLTLYFGNQVDQDAEKFTIIGFIANFQVYDTEENLHKKYDF